jgi:hypothetical protein
MVEKPHAVSPTTIIRLHIAHGMQQWHSPKIAILVFIPRISSKMLTTFDNTGTLVS